MAGLAEITGLLVVCIQAGNHCCVAGNLLACLTLQFSIQRLAFSLKRRLGWRQLGIDLRFDALQLGLNVFASFAVAQDFCLIDRNDRGALSERCRRNQGNCGE